MAEIKSRIKASIKLSAIGDALGFITETAKTTEKLKDRSGVTMIDQFYDWKMPRGRFGDSLGTMPAGSYSDDTQLMLATARSLKSNGTVDHNSFAKQALPTWHSYKVGAGNTVSAAALKITRKSADWNSNFYTFKRNDGSTRDYRDCAANGVAMRIGPIALANYNDFETMKEQIFGNAIVTHGHPRAIAGAILYGYVIHKIFKTDSKSFEPNQFLEALRSSVRSKLALPFLSKAEFKDWVSTWNKPAQRNFITEYNLVLGEIDGLLNKVYTGVTQGRKTADFYVELGAFKKPPKSYGTITVAIAIYLLCKYHNNPPSGIIEAVNMLGSDTDTIGSIAGGMFGALHGEKIIPEKWTGVQDFEYLELVGDRIYNISLGINPVGASIIKNPTFNLKTGDYKALAVGSQIHIDPLGDGTITNVVNKSTPRSGKKKVYITIKFEIGQSCTFSKLVPK